MKTPANNNTPSEQSSNPIIHQSPRLFTQPGILEQIGFARIAKFLDSFADDLKAANLTIPPLKHMNRFYFAEVAHFLAATNDLPDSLRQTMATLETATVPQNEDQLDTLIKRHIPNVSLNRLCPLDCALELWFAAPDSLDCFARVSFSSSSSISGGPSSESSFSPEQSEVPLPNRDSSPLPVPGSTVPSSTVQPSAVPVSAADSISSPIENGNGSTHPPIQASTNPSPRVGNGIILPPGWVMEVEPSAEPVDGKSLLDTLRAALLQRVVMPKWVPETVALFIVHTYAFELREITTYLGVESPMKRCGKSTLITLLCRLVNRPVVSSNVSSPALFHAIEDLRPTLMIDETDTFLKPNGELQGVLNAGYNRPTAYVLRVGQQLPSADSPRPSDGRGIKGEGSRLVFFSCWCPKVISRIGRLPDTLADRCIVFRMQRKTPKEQCQRLRTLDSMPLRRQCARFVRDHADAIANAKPEIPEALNDRAADIWEPLFAIADLAGGEWPNLARQAALGLSAGSPESNPVGSLLLDIFLLFCSSGQDRMFSRSLLDGLTTNFSDRPWMELGTGKQPTEIWLARQLRPFGVCPRTIRADGTMAKGYFRDDFTEAFRRYIPRSELENLTRDASPPDKPTA